MVFDEDANNYISRDEFKDIISHFLIDRLNEIRGDELDLIFDTIDVTHTDRISFREFQGFYNALSR